MGMFDFIKDAGEKIFKPGEAKAEDAISKHIGSYGLDIKGLKVDAEFAPSMIYVSNEDKPGFVGRFATTLCDAGVNIATFALGRDEPGGSAIALVEVDGELPADVFERVMTIPGVKQVKPLAF